MNLEKVLSDSIEVFKHFLTSKLIMSAQEEIGMQTTMNDAENKLNITQANLAGIFPTTNDISTTNIYKIASQILRTK